MGRGQSNNSGANGGQLSRQQADRLRWIKDNFAQTSPTLANPDFTRILTAEHGHCPAKGTDPLAGFPQDIEQATPEKQLEAFEQVYGQTVSHGHGMIINLMAVSFDEFAEADSAAESYVANRAAESLNTDNEVLADEIFEHVAQYQEQEAKLTWACQKLNWPADWMVNYLRERGKENLAQYQQPQAIDEDLITTQLALEELPENIKHSSHTEKIAALNEAYGQFIDQYSAVIQLENGINSQKAQDLMGYLHKEIDSDPQNIPTTINAFNMQLQARQRQFTWATKALNLTPADTLAELIRIRQN